MRRTTRCVPAMLGLYATFILAAAVDPVDLTAQERPTAPTPAPPLSVSPGGAFLRALAFPGWGHVSIGAYTRGGFYFGAQSAVVYTALVARTRVGEAQDRRRLRESLVRAQLAADGVTDPQEVEEAVLADPGIAELTSLLESRKDQQEDMVALAIFFWLLSGVDAYVSAHLARFPEPLDVSAEPSMEGGIELSLRLAVPN